MRNDVVLAHGDWQGFLLELCKQYPGKKRGFMAARAGVAPATWWRWVTGRQKPGPDDLTTLRRFADGFSIDLGQVKYAAGHVGDRRSGTAPVDPKVYGLRADDPNLELITELACGDEELHAFMLDYYREQLAHVRRGLQLLGRRAG